MHPVFREAPRKGPKLGKRQRRAVIRGSTMCDTCGEQLVQGRVVALVVEDCAKEKLH